MAGKAPFVTGTQTLTTPSENGPLSPPPLQGQGMGATARLDALSSRNGRHPRHWRQRDAAATRSRPVGATCAPPAHRRRATNATLARHWRATGAARTRPMRDTDAAPTRHPIKRRQTQSDGFSRVFALRHRQRSQPPPRKPAFRVNRSQPHPPGARRSAAQRASRPPAARFQGIRHWPRAAQRVWSRLCRPNPRAGTGARTSG